MLGYTQFDHLITAAPVNSAPVKVNWTNLGALLDENNVDPDTLLAATWCSFGERNIEALIDADALTMIFPTGILSSSGKTSLLGNKPRFDAIDLDRVKKWGDSEYEDPRGLGKYCIEFAGPGDILLGRLQWSWRKKRFRDPREHIMAVASERDRISSLLQGLLTPHG